MGLKRVNGKIMMEPSVRVCHTFYVKCGIISTLGTVRCELARHCDNRNCSHFVEHIFNPAVCEASVCKEQVPKSNFRRITL